MQIAILLAASAQAPFTFEGQFSRWLMERHHATILYGISVKVSNSHTSPILPAVGSTQTRSADLYVWSISHGSDETTVNLGSAILLQLAIWEWSRTEKGELI